ncbi:hypothetical protein [Burkholderia cenocepacia]|uniref:hypothetical protein n=1 Tax=Burkholderia cenocepacia TaxID=95486 RepID=UPI002AB31A8C|nr:hypothetical protein [Burkholderia cenocepacia]
MSRNLLLGMAVAITCSAAASSITYFLTEQRHAAHEADRAYRVSAECHQIATKQWSPNGPQYAAFMAGCERRFQ